MSRIPRNGDGSHFYASPVIAITTDHEGGDVASPGAFPGSTVSGNFAGNGTYECNDVDSLVAEIVAGISNASFELTADNSVRELIS